MNRSHQLDFVEIITCCGTGVFYDYRCDFRELVREGLLLIEGAGNFPSSLSGGPQQEGLGAAFRTKCYREGNFTRKE